MTGPQSTSLCAAGTAALLLLAGPGLAAPQPIEVTARLDPNARSQVVSYKDLDLTDVAQRKALNRRLSSAVGAVCEPYEPSSVSTAYNHCRVGAWRVARPQVEMAVRRAHEIAATGTSSIPAAAILVVAPSR